MNDKEFNTRLRELIAEIANLPKKQQKQLGSLIDETKQRHKDIKKNMDEVAESLEDLRICIKYLLFDLEATRRERDRLRKMLSNWSTDDDKPNGTDGEM